MRRCLNKIVILVVGFIGEVLACVGEDVSGDVDGVNPTHMCHRSFGVVQRNKKVCEGGTEFFLALLLFLFLCDGLEVAISDCAFCDGEIDLYR